MLKSLDLGLTAALLVVAALCVIYVAAVHFVSERAKLDGRPPVQWLLSSGPKEKLEVPGHDVAYWGKPDARYSIYATRGRQKPRAIVVHHTVPLPVRKLIAYGHRTDPYRGGASFGYHFYIGRDGRIAQGAPLSKRTNHIKSSKRPQRTSLARHLWSGNTMSLSLVGGCDPLRAPVWRHWRRCAKETATPAQVAAALAVIDALQARYGMACGQVYGHGELQTDRQPFEGAIVTRLARDRCGADTAADDGSRSPSNRRDDPRVEG